MVGACAQYALKMVCLQHQPCASAVSKAKLQIDARKWAASKIAPKKYGDKVEQQITGNLAIQADVKLSDLFLSDEE